MKAMILAAGYGRRLQAVTGELPKPLVMVSGRPLIVYAIEALARAGCDTIVINVAMHTRAVPQVLGDGERYGVSLLYSYEGGQPLETGGGIVNALPLLGEQPFIIMNGDVWTNYPLRQLCQHSLSGLAHLVLVDRSQQQGSGDFSLVASSVSSPAPATGIVQLSPMAELLYSGIGLYHPDLFQGKHPRAFPLATLLREAVKEKRVSGEHYRGKWVNVNTPDALDMINGINSYR